MNNDDDKSMSTCEVGYKKPPAKTRFQKGRSGNPSGRPRGSLNLDTEFRRALEAEAIVIEHGERKSVSKMRAGMIQLANKFAGGDLKATKLVMDMGRQIEKEEKHAGPAPKFIVEVVYDPLPEQKPINLKKIIPDD